MPDSRLRVLIAGINYWPEETGIAPYTTELAQHLAANGAQVAILTAMPSYPSWKVFEGYRGTRGRSHECGVDVWRFRSYVPSRQSAGHRAAYELTFFAHGITHGRLPFHPDVILGVVPSLSGGMLARIEARRYRCPYGLIVQDLMGQAAAQSGIRGGFAAAGATRGIEGWIARGAAGVAVIAEGFRPYLEQIGVDPTRIRHVPNWTHLRPVTQSRNNTRIDLGWPVGVQIVLHSGNMGLKQGLEHVVSTARAAAATQPNVRFVLMGDGSQRPSLEAMSQELPNVEFRDLVHDEMYPNVLSAADVLLVNERASIMDMSLPGKLTSYFAAGRPILASVRLEGATGREVERSGAGIVVPAEDSEAFLAALSRLGLEDGLGARLGAAGAAYAATDLTAAAGLARAEAFITHLAMQGRVEPKHLWRDRPRWSSR